MHVSRHLRLLSEAGRVVAPAEDTRRRYRLDGAGVVTARRYLESVWGDVAARFRLAAENLPREPG